MTLAIRTTTQQDIDTILDIHRQAFGQDEEADLVSALLSDETAAPRVSLLARVDAQDVGHILFTKVTAGDLIGSILCPLAVRPQAQKSGVGRQLITQGIEQLRAEGVDVIFVFGDPKYYGKFGFEPAAAQGLSAPHPIPPQYANAWMARALSPRRTVAQVQCSDTLNDPRYWDV